MKIKSTNPMDQSIAPTARVSLDGEGSPAAARKNLNGPWLTIGLAVAVMLAPHNLSAAQGGTDIMHFNSKTIMLNTGVEHSASGNISMILTSQGNAEKQQLNIMASKLSSLTAYRLVAYLGDDTNATDIAGFITDKKGSCKIAYMKTGQGNSGKNQKPFPAVLDPMCNIRELDINNGSSNAVLSAVLFNPDQGQYMVKNFMKNTGFLPAAVGSFSINANSKTTKFQLTASGLTPNTNYSLAINGVTAQTYTSDKNGRLMVRSMPTNAPSVLEIQTVALTDGPGTNAILLTEGLGIPCTPANLASTQAPIVLGTAADYSFAVLAGSTVANTGITAIYGDLGLSPGSAVTGFPPGIVVGTNHVADATAAQAQLDLTVAYNDAAGRTVGAISVAGNLGGLTLPPGLYKSSSSLEISSGDLTLDALGNTNAVFIFQIASTLTTTSGRQVILSGGAKAANIFWQVGTSAVLGTTSVFEGTIMADQSITLATGAKLDGRALARAAAVTLDNNIVIIPVP